MPDQLPAPEFDRTKYERPNDAWICGHACDGRPCRLGPSAGGECRAGSECRPVLDKRPGEEKGRWRCTRPPAHGGPCENGPGPAGDCACAIARCVPRRSLRRIRHLVTLAVIALTFGLLLIALGSRWRWRWISPDTVSQAHQGGAFARLAHDRLEAVNECGACHEAANAGLRSWISAARTARPGPFSRGQFQVLAAGISPMTTMDRQSCAICHGGHEFHQPNVVEAGSCSACHVEHRGLKLVAPTDTSCTRCHNDAGVMAVSSLKGGGLPAEHFDPPIRPGLRAFRTPRPAGGRTNLIASFWQGHPNFGVLAQRLKDPDTLRFNHALHLGDMVRLNGGQLGCANCHLPDATGAYMARINYAQHCAACHDLQFDPAHPELRVPHGDVNAVRAVLRGLPLLYSELRSKQLLATGLPPAREEVDAFSKDNVARMRRTFGDGEALERLVLFTGDPRAWQPGLGAERRAHYAGCAYCHEVRPDRLMAATIAPVFIPDRWLLNGRFDHGRHSQQACESCHAVRSSRSAADINLPAQVTCVRCHQPGGSGPANCSVCHTYHLQTGN